MDSVIQQKDSDLGGAMDSLVLERDFSLSMVAERLTPSYNMVEKLMQDLALCTMYATTTRAASITIKIPQLSSTEEGFIARRKERESDLGTELDALTNDGYDTFSDINEFLNELREESRDLARPGGPVRIPDHVWLLNRSQSNTYNSSRNCRLILQIQTQLETMNDF
jgi:hypothetical protein